MDMFFFLSRPILSQACVQRLDRQALFENSGAFREYLFPKLKPSKVILHPYYPWLKRNVILLFIFLVFVFVLCVRALYF